jgi:alkanesulfonate monooxygenase SsuD/methylene tetrahydromethanopterin reductase-like flavin-dependent oxidoreductase (luciferase family)
VPDYGRPLEFGVSTEPIAADPGMAARIAIAADRAGLDLLGIQDHPYNPAYLDTMSTLATLVPMTERLRLLPDVANLPLRPPAVLANAAATLDVLSGGRFELGLGAGWAWPQIEAMGGERRDPAQAVKALEEAIAVIRLAWSDQGPVEFEGDHYHLRGHDPGPPPAHAIGIWLGAYGPRMLALTGWLADGWIPSLGPAPVDRIPGMQALVDEGAEAAGRSPAEIRRAYNMRGTIGTQQRGLLDGPVDHWVETLTGFATHLGLDTFVFWPATDPVAQLERFAHEVAPAVREAVTKAR